MGEAKAFGGLLSKLCLRGFSEPVISGGLPTIVEDEPCGGSLSKLPLKVCWDSGVTTELDTKGEAKTCGGLPL